MAKESKDKKPPPKPPRDWRKWLAGGLVAGAGAGFAVGSLTNDSPPAVHISVKPFDKSKVPPLDSGATDPVDARTKPPETSPQIPVTPIRAETTREETEEELAKRGYIKLKSYIISIESELLPFLHYGPNQIDKVTGQEITPAIYLDTSKLTQRHYIDGKESFIKFPPSDDPTLPPDSFVLVPAGTANAAIAIITYGSDGDIAFPVLVPGQKMSGGHFLSVNNEIETIEARYRLKYRELLTPEQRNDYDRDTFTTNDEMTKLTEEQVNRLKQIGSERTAEYTSLEERLGGSESFKKLDNLASMTTVPELVVADPKNRWLTLSVNAYAERRKGSPGWNK